ncbi:homocitrate synthase/isopropylmalate synthase family protein, partial [Streptomyces tendae]|uniref:homocitrate synthase/isopropylmalate synthase family protein n=1 Tax=Streptomyces tendae TaxID=1932 RepID=UPI0036CD7BF9
IHQDGMLKNRNMYQFIMPEEIGGAKEVMPISGISSRKVIEKYLNEIGIDYSNSTEIIEFYRSVSKLIDDLSLREITLLFEFLQGSILGGREGENHELTV